MGSADVGFVLDALAAAGVDACVGGGWGVDALVGSQTRDHHDLDLYVDFADFLTVDRVLREHGLSVATDWLPTRAQYEDARGRAVDVHPVRVAADGAAELILPDGRVARFPPGDLAAAGTIGDRQVRCLTAARQRTAHLGYEPGPKDRHDLAVLADLNDG